MNDPGPPTRVRHVIVGITAFAAFLMYLDRICMAQIVNSESFHREFGFAKQTTGYLLSMFFLAYALGQLPAGWLADRFGARSLMTWFIALWSICTALTGFATGFWTLLLTRLGCGAAEAGAYPASGSLLSRWVPLHRRGIASSVVAGGGRFGGAMAPFLTAAVIIWVGHWRAAGWTFGAVGIVFAGAFWFLFRDRPAEHPLINESERRLIEQDLPLDQATGGRRRGGLPIGPLIRSPGMWLMCLYQFLGNVGWVFLATLMPTFLKDHLHLDELTTGRLSTVALLVGMLGMFAGGWLTDQLTRRYGVRRGRMIPLVGSRIVGASAYIACLWLHTPWAFVAALAIVALTSDLSIPATWAYTQDVGGRNVAAALAWPNMWGNLGAAATPIALGWINEHLDANHDWHESFLFQAGAFILAAIVAFGIDANRKLVVKI